MADANVNLAAPTGNADTRTAPDGDHRQVVVLGDPTTASVVGVSTQGGSYIQGAPYTATATVVAAAGTGTLGPVDVSGAGNVTFWVANGSGTAFTGAPVVVFEQSYDNTNWAPLNVVRSDTQQSCTSLVVPTLPLNAAIAFDAAAEGVGWMRARVTAGTTANSIALAMLPGGGFFEPSVATVERNNAGRTSVNMYLSGVTAGTSGTEALQTMTISRGTAATTTGTTYAIGAGKTLRITGIRFQHIGHATATAATTTWRMRLNTAGAITVTSTPILFQARTQTPATSNAKDAYDVPVSEGFEIVNPAGGAVNIGFTAQPTFTTNAPTYDIHLVGYEY